MVMDAVIERCAQHSPLTVMARLALQRALEPAWVDALFERDCGAQYTRELLFSTTVELMSVVPGHALVVYDPDREMVVDLAPCEDGQRAAQQPWNYRFTAASGFGCVSFS